MHNLHFRFFLLVSGLGVPQYPLSTLTESSSVKCGRQKRDSVHRLNLCITTRDTPRVNLAIVKILVTIFIFLTIIGESIFIHQIKGGKRTWRRGWRRREGSRQPYLTNCLRKFRWCDWKFFGLGEFRSNKIHLQGHNSGNTAPLRSVHWTPGRKILCSWTNHFTFTVPLSAQE